MSNRLPPRKAYPLHRPLAAALLAPMVALACETPPPAALEAPPAALTFMNGPHELPNVYRSDATGRSGAGVLFVWADPATDLVLVVNAPSDPNDLLACGGTQRPDLSPVQDVGGMQGVVRELRLLKETNLHLYRPVPPGFTLFRELCGMSPVATGTGRVTSTDNDVTMAGPGSNAWGFRAQGVLEFAEGGSARVTGVRQLLIRPDGTCCDVLSSRVMLH